ncbi:MAG: TIR domain-containing protein [Chitinivibrionales bacterium]|nr:TIR domain-containing protein [Chitinivibrionales bacterium]
MAKRVYFAFHYKDVIDFRANVVRKHNFLQGVEKAGYYDASIWEEAKKTSPLALKRLINKELENTTVTTVLIGTETCIRPWVRYEILKSLERGNSVLGVHINSIPGKDQKTKANGPNPFDYIGLSVSEDGRTARPTEWNGTKWVYYSELDQFAIAEQPLDKRNKNWQLSYWFKTYDWIADKGYDNFTDWIK